MFGIKKARKIESAPVIPAEAYVFTDEQEKAFAALEIDADGMFRLGDMARNVLGEQCQYVSYHFDGVANRPVLTEGLRVDNSGSSYHSYRINAEDAREFIARLRAYRIAQRG